MTGQCRSRGARHPQGGRGELGRNYLQGRCTPSMPALPLGARPAARWLAGLGPCSALLHGGRPAPGASHAKPGATQQLDSAGSSNGTTEQRTSSQAGCMVPRCCHERAPIAAPGGCSEARHSGDCEGAGLRGRLAGWLAGAVARAGEAICFGWRRVEWCRAVAADVLVQPCCCSTRHQFIAQLQSIIIIIVVH